MVFGEKVHSEPGLTEALSYLFTVAFRVHNETHFYANCRFSGISSRLKVEVCFRGSVLYSATLRPDVEVPRGSISLEPASKDLNVASIREVTADLEKVLRDGRIIIEAFDKEKADV